MVMTCSTTDATAVATNLRRCFLERWHVADVKNITSDDQATLIVDRNFADIAYTFQFYNCLCLRDHDYCTVAEGNGSLHGLAPSFFEEMTRCWRQKHRRWPGNHNGRSKFQKYCIYLPILPLFTSTRSSLMLRGWRQRQFPWTHAIVFRRDDTLLTWKTSPAMIRQPWWSIEIPQISRIPSDFTSVYVYEIATGTSWLMAMAVAADSRRPFSKRWHIADVKNIADDDQDRSKFRNYKNLCIRLWNHARPFEKHLFVLGRRHYDAIAHSFFP